MKNRTLTVLRGLGRRLAPAPVSDSLNRGHAPLGMLDVERITRTAAPIATIVSRPAPSSASTSSSFLKG